jgi:hypothetical protein
MVGWCVVQDLAPYSDGGARRAWATLIKCAIRAVADGALANPRVPNDTNQVVCAYEQRTRRAFG